LIASFMFIFMADPPPDPDPGAADLLVVSPAPVQILLPI